MGFLITLRGSLEYICSRAQDKPGLHEHASLVEQTGIAHNISAPGFSECGGVGDALRGWALSVPQGEAPMWSFLPSLLLSEQH